MAEASDMPEPVPAPPERVLPIPGLHLASCPWCYRPAEKCFLLAYDRDGKFEFEVMCQQCSAAAGQFAAMRQNGLSRWEILADFGHRGPEVTFRRPAKHRGNK